MARRTRAGNAGERGFTLAALIVILSIMMIFVAYTVPRQWSAIMQREREKQTIFLMRQFARATWEFQHRNHSYPTSIDQLVKARQPRFLRGKDLPIDPLTGQVDWLVVPMSSAMQGRNTTVPGQVTPPPPPTTSNPDQPTPPPNTTNPPTTSDTSGSSSDKTSTSTPGQPGTQQIQAFPIKDYAGGPFVGIRSPKTGKSMIMLNGSDDYSQWNFTALDVDTEMQAHNQANATIYH